VTNDPPPRGAQPQLAILAIAMVLGMTPWFSATVAAPGMIAEWGIAAGAAAWLTVAVQIGFVIGTSVSAFLLLSDRFSARLLAAVSSAVAGAATALLAWPHIGPIAAIGLRVLTGIALAGVYPPGIKIAAGWWRTRRGTAIGVLVGALTIGSAAPNLFRVASRSADWRAIVLAAALASLSAGLLFAWFIREGPFKGPATPFDPTALALVFRDRGVMLATGGYLGHMWELYAMWSSIGVFWGYVVAQRALPSLLAPVLAFTTIAVGSVGCVVAGIAADRVGRATVTIVAMAISGSCALAIGSLIHAPIGALVFVTILWGGSIVADSAQFSASVTELAPAQYVGTAITFQTCVGFLLTIASIRLVPVWVEQWGWQVAFAPLAIGPALGIVSMWRLRVRSVARESR
jgi:MFS family permease